MSDDRQLKMGIWTFENGRAATCDLCGQRFGVEVAMAVAMAVVQDGDRWYGDVCPKCLEAGPQGIAARIAAYVQRLRTEADFLESLQAPLEAISWVSPQDLEQTAKAYWQWIHGPDASGDSREDIIPF